MGIDSVGIDSGNCGRHIYYFSSTLLLLLSVFVAKRNYVSIFFFLEDNCFTIMCWFLPYGFPRGSDCKESACNVGNLGLSPGLGRSPRDGHGNPLQYFFFFFVEKNVITFIEV